MTIKTIIQPTEEPITLQEAKAQLRIEISMDEDDSLIEGLIIPTAREMVENDTRRSIMTQTRTLQLDNLSDYFEIMDGAVQSIVDITYKDLDNVTQRLASTDYELFIREESALVVPEHDKTWPAALNRPGSVTVQFVAGYDDAESVPKRLKQAMMMLISDFYENREDIIIGASTAENVFGYDRLIMPYVSWRF